MTTQRVHNFSAGPAMLPLPVLEEAQRDLVSLPGVGMSVLEISHRSKAFAAIIESAQADLRKLLAIPDGYHLLFLQGGATLQFAMVAMNLGRDGRADYIDTGSWAKAAMKEAQKFTKVQTAASTQADNYNRVPRQSELKLDSGATYVHYTTNETIGGVEWHEYPEVGAVPLICDSSSDFLSKPFDIGRHAVVYAGAQKNVGPAGVTVVILRDDMLKRVPAGLPVLLDYKAMVEGKSLYNTPPVFPIYVVGLVAKWLLGLGGLAEMHARNQAKARLVYDALDSSGGYYRGHAQPGSRSNMNVTWRMGSEALETLFVKEATAAGLDGLKGHRSVGGLRASIYNAFPEAGVKALVDFMKEFQKKHG
ncbi:MAG: 3-phosphoserine/phosphohydroxythreonine transaminase [Candidatus Riflebacteria bacterium]|nr:3-phosphoserine/phosphohydroxythreonine transaminase [Candidatus Riflebacteria bacterium]